MTRTQWMWLVLVAVWALFFGWYTSFGGPLTEEEIAGYMDRMESREPRPSASQLERLRRFMEEDTGGDFVMVNLIDMHDTPIAVGGVEPGQSSDDVLGRYMAYMGPALFARACHPVLYGVAASAAMDLVDADGMETWSAGAGMRYRSRRDLMEIATHSGFAAAHVFKVAAMRKTIAFPIDPWFQLGDPRLVLGLLLAVIGCGLGWREATRRASQP